MGAVFAAASRAPITALLIIFELTGNYRIILPLMFAIVVATALANALTRDTIYTLKLRRRGIDIDASRGSELTAGIAVRDAMGRAPDGISPDQPLSEILARFAAEHSDSLPVLDADGRLIGVVSAVDVEQSIGKESDATLVASALAREPPRLLADDSFKQAVHALAATEEDGIPVLAPDESHVIGWLTHRRLLRAYHARSRSNGPG
jgi:CIC family chloride channel protein